MPLDPKTNREARAETTAEAHEPPALNPDFPYKLVSFDPFYFGVEKDPPKPPDAS